MVDEGEGGGSWNGSAGSTDTLDTNDNSSDTGGGGKTKNKPDKNDSGCDPSKPDCIFVTGEQLDHLSDIYWGAAIGEIITAMVLLLLVAPALGIPYIGGAVALILFTAAVELLVEAGAEAGSFASELNSMATSVGSSGGITVERVQYGPDGFWGTGVHFQGFQKQNETYVIFGVVDKLILNQWFNNIDH